MLGFSLEELQTLDYRYSNDIYQASVEMLRKWKMDQPSGSDTKQMIQDLLDSCLTLQEGMCGGLKI